MTDSEYLEAKTKFLEEIKKNNEEILEIEKLAREQADCDIWILERRKLTAAMFGSVCKRSYLAHKDEESSFLADTPDGLIDDRGIVEIKYLYSPRNMMPEEGIETKKITFWSKNGDINKMHQVQGQLQISR
ncbi:unnamed protein product [Psylliodes chrysocephalus]|uniref:YqaJ viral recombinase domain-containing protein n=1 Tax=Psylliodes chrysocephalus TaxID=3402493 RepID=A0A9P0GH49_9CUCU|nr:unnamed protein product [Psylliodes chrysocephala]